MKQSLLQRLALFAGRRYRLVFGVTAVVSVISLGLATRLGFETDILSLLPKKDQRVQTYVRTLEDFGSNTYLLVAMRIPEGKVLDPYESLADDLAGRLRTLPELKSVEHHLGEPQELLTTFFPRAVLFLDDAGRQAVAAKLSDDGIRARVSELRRLVGTPQALALKQLMTRDPFGLSEVFLDRLSSSRGALQVDWASGYYLSLDHRLLLILAEPVRPPQDILFDERLETVVQAQVRAALARWPEIAGPDGPPAPVIDLGGPYMTALGDASLIRHDMLVNIVTSAVGVLLLFLFAFRRLGALIYAFVPLICGLLVTFGFSKLAVGSLSSATSVVAALLIGLGIDFVIVCYGRYIEERQQGGTFEQALLAMSGSSGRAVVTGAITTTATFYAFTITDFTGLRQMGLLTGTGILFCALATFTLLPAMLAWSHQRHVRRGTEPKLFLHSFGIGGLLRASMRHPRPVLLAGAAVTAACLALAFRISFDESMKTMRPQGNRGIDVAVEVGQRFGAGFDQMVLVLEGSSVEEVVKLSGQAAAGAEKLVREGVLYGYSGVTSLIPPPDQQAAALAWLERGRSDALDLARIGSTFDAALAAEGLRREPFMPGLDLLGQAVSLSGPVGAEDFAGNEQTRLLLDRFLKRTPEGWKAAVYLYPPGNRWRREPPPQAVRLAEELGPGAALTGPNVINQLVRVQVLRDAWVAGILGFLLVGLLLWVDFRNLRQALIALAPLTGGLILMLGSMVLFGLQMNFINIFVTTMIIGIGVDYGLHVLHRYREVRDLPRAEFERGLHETGKAVVAAAASTIVGFGSITFSHYPGLQSTGKVAILGAVCTSLVAVTILPALLALRRQARERAGLAPSAETGEVAETGERG
jgi:predicted RND superfamily exporter protein